MNKTTSSSLILVTGPARSGKSEWAEKLAYQSSLPVIYLATAFIDPEDEEWQNRIAKHRQRRPPQWQTQEVGGDLATPIHSSPCSYCLLIDSLGTWVARFVETDDIIWENACETLLTSLRTTKASVILVAEEVGWGLVPSYRSGRVFRDRLGTLVRKIASFASTVYLVTAGYVLNLSVLGHPL